MGNSIPNISIPVWTLCVVDSRARVIEQNLIRLVVTTNPIACTHQLMYLHPNPNSNCRNFQ